MPARRIETTHISSPLNTGAFMAAIGVSIASSVKAISRITSYANNVLISRRSRRKSAGAVSLRRISVNLCWTSG